MMGQPPALGRAGRRVEIDGVGRYEFPVPEGAATAACSSCGAGIIWVRTVAARRMPLSARTMRTDAQGDRWAEAHFTDCPDADRHRRRRRA